MFALTNKCEIDKAENGFDVLKYIMSNFYANPQTFYDLVVLDIEMQDGLDTCKNILEFFKY